MTSWRTGTAPLHVTVATEAHFRRGPDGLVRSDTDGRAYPFWRRYLEAFTSVTVLARVSDTVNTDGHAVTGPSVVVLPMPGYTGMVGAARQLVSSARVVREACRQPNTAYLARVPGLAGALLAGRLRRLGRPHGLEVVGDPYEVFRSGVSGRGLGAILAAITQLQMRRQCSRAAAVAYVTREQLQRRYPASRAAFTTYFSSVDLPDEAYIASPRPVRAGVPVLVAVGTQSQPYKGHDVLLEAVAHLISTGTAVRLRLVGGGRLRPELERQAAALGIGDSVSFAGQLPGGSEVRRELDAADIFVLPSRTEGLPRAVIEAMARGLPCVASAVGGVPELLPPSDTVPPGDAAALARLLGEVIADPARRAEMARRNLTAAADYRAATLATRRLGFYRALADVSAEAGRTGASASSSRTWSQSA